VEVLAEEEEEATEDEGSPDTEAVKGGELWSQSARNTFTISSPGIVQEEYRKLCVGRK
jgi:hypothetical protein